MHFHTYRIYKAGEVFFLKPSHNTLEEAHWHLVNDLGVDVVFAEVRETSFMVALNGPLREVALIEGFAPGEIDPEAIVRRKRARE